MDNKTPGRLYGTGTIAKLFGVGERRIQQLTQEGVLVQTKTKDARGYELGPTIQRYVKYLSDKAYNRSATAREAELKAKKLEAEISLKESQAELHQLKTDIAAGRYLPIEDAVDDYRAFFITFKRFALGLPGRLVDEIGDRIDPVEARRLKKSLRKEAAGMLESFAVAGRTIAQAELELQTRAAQDEEARAAEPGDWDMEELTTYGAEAEMEGL